MNVADIVKYWGTKREAARQLRCDPTAINQWERRYAGEIPWPWQCAAYYASAGALKPKPARLPA